MIFPAHEAVTPDGKFTIVPIPVAPVVVCVIGVKTVLTHIGGELDPGVTVLFGLTVINPIAEPPHPPTNGIL